MTPLAGGCPLWSAPQDLVELLSKRLEFGDLTLHRRELGAYCLEEPRTHRTVRATLQARAQSPHLVEGQPERTGSADEEQTLDVPR